MRDSIRGGSLECLLWPPAFRGIVCYRNVGDLSLVSYDGKELTVNREGAGQLDVKGVTTLLCSQGVWQALGEIDLEKLLSGRRHPYEKAQNIIEAVNRRNLKNQRSALAVIVA